MQTSTSPAPTPTPSPESGSSTPIGGIIAGSVVGGVVVIAILAFAAYKISRHRKAVSTQQSSEDYYTAYPQGVNQQGYPPQGKEQGMEQGMQEAPFQRQSLRYPDPDEVGVSANLRQEI